MISALMAAGKAANHIPHARLVAGTVVIALIVAAVVVLRVFGVWIFAALACLVLLAAIPAFLHDRAIGRSATVTAVIGALVLLALAFGWLARRRQRNAQAAQRPRRRVY